MNGGVLRLLNASGLRRRSSEGDTPAAKVTMIMFRRKTWRWFGTVHLNKTRVRLGLLDEFYPFFCCTSLDLLDLRSHVKQAFTVWVSWGPRLHLQLKLLKQLSGRCRQPRAAQASAWLHRGRVFGPERQRRGGQVISSWCGTRSTGGINVKNSREK